MAMLSPITFIFLSLIVGIPILALMIWLIIGGKGGGQE
jgi:hypothetical protein